MSKEIKENTKKQINKTTEQKTETENKREEIREKFTEKPSNKKIVKEVSPLHSFHTALKPEKLKTTQKNKHTIAKNPALKINFQNFSKIQEQQDITINTSEKIPSHGTAFGLPKIRNLPYNNLILSR